MLLEKGIVQVFLKFAIWIEMSSYMREHSVFSTSFTFLLDKIKFTSVYLYLMPLFPFNVFFAFVFPFISFDIQYSLSVE